MNMKLIFLVSLTILMVVVGACDRYIDSRDPVRSVPQDGPVPYNLRVFVNHQSVTVSWDISGSSPVGKYRIYVATEPEESDEFNFILLDSTTNTTIELDELTINKRYYFRVTAVSTSGLEWEPSEVTNALFTYLSIDIEHGRDRVNNRSVQIQISAPAQISHIMISEDETFASDNWIPFVGTMADFELSDGDGAKWVYVQLQFNDGSLTGDILSDSIILDTRAVIDSVFFGTPANSEYFVAGETVTFGVATSESGGEASVSFDGGLSGAIVLYDEGTGADLTADDGIYYGDWIVPTSYSLDHGEVTGRFTDEAGNSANDRTAARLLTIFTMPQAVTVSANSFSTFQINLIWTQSISSTENFASYRIYRDTSPTVSESSFLVKNETNRSTTSFTDTLLDDNTTYYYCVYVYEKSGLSAASKIVSTTTLLNTIPEPVELFAVDNGSETTTELMWTISTEADFESYQIYRPNTALTSQPSLSHFTTLVWRGNDINTIQRANISLTAATDSSWYFVIYVFDKHGEKSAASNVVSVLAPPVSPEE
ncbi:MAG: hypothetical protein DRP47_08020 [Candidatus Zixiibacteriota bacterium]|nr:MAG: hypothetical protein DRP47_08020 [candidate division Zixibacteria bacterium]